MKGDLLPIGTLIEVEDGIKLIIISYEFNEKISYLCAGYPSYYLTDFIPNKHVDEFKNKYKHYNVDRFVDINSEFNIIHMGYKNDEFYKFVEKYKNY